MVSTIMVELADCRICKLAKGSVWAETCIFCETNCTNIDYWPFQGEIREKICIIRLCSQDHKEKLTIIGQDRIYGEEYKSIIHTHPSHPSLTLSLLPSILHTIPYTHPSHPFLTLSLTSILHTIPNKHPSHPSLTLSLTPIPHTIPHTHPSHYPSYSSLTSVPQTIPSTHPSHQSLTLSLTSIPHTIPHTMSTQQGSRLCVTHRLVFSMFHSCVRHMAHTLFQYT